ncbi:STIV orfB116 family protein [Methanobrevibacter olleyae]|uniref:Phage-related protein n=1 Tax=Methanobrevibacter olleyae TaxID=294671 RepID=A0A126R1X4_METOL|nr:DUF1874 domain-containing protein [Methanobrevibacter olleyae]AMK16281.1 phage-related protein [Methanobrevibacter olleyae]
MLNIKNHKIIEEAGDSFFGKEDDVDGYVHTVFDVEFEGFDFSFDKGGEIKNPRAWFINYALEECVHHCEHYDLLQLAKVEDESEFFTELCEDDFIEGVKPDIRKEICYYSTEMCYNSDIFFCYYSFLKDRVTEENILNCFLKVLRVKEAVGSEFFKLAEMYDIHLNRERELISLTDFIVREEKLSLEVDESDDDSSSTEPTVYVGNVFTFGFLDNPNVDISSQQISWEEFDEVLENKDFVNFMGHADVAHMVGLDMNRITIHVKPGDTVYIAQYTGPRLEEGATVLPDGATLVPLKVEVKEGKGASL